MPPSPISSPHLSRPLLALADPPPSAPPPPLQPLVAALGRACLVHPDAYEVGGLYRLEDPAAKYRERERREREERERGRGERGGERETRESERPSRARSELACISTRNERSERR